MKFLFVANTERDPNAGASGCDIATIESLRRAGHECDEIWGTDLPRVIRHPNLHQLIELPRRFARAIQKQTIGRFYDVVQVNQPHAFWAARQHQMLHRGGLFVNRSHGWEPLVSEAMTALSRDLRPVYRRAASVYVQRVVRYQCREVLKWSDAVILCSQDDKDYIVRQNIVNPDKLLALAPGIANEFLDAEPTPWQLKGRDILHVAGFSPQKAPEIVAAVFRDLLKCFPSLKLTWVCGARNHGDAQRLLGPETAKQVRFLDWMPRSELMTVYDDHKVFLFPSYFEGFALSFLEAMSRGCCVVASRIDGMRQTIVSGENGFTVASGDIQGFKHAVAAVLAGSRNMGDVSDAAKATARRFTWDRTAAEYAAFCEARLADKRTAATKHPE
jgi:glycosyltransferase involved in cell wall biosynthesis